MTSAPPDQQENALRFAVYAGETLIGHSALEYGDPPMGVVFGRFWPIEAYAAIRQSMAEHRGRDQTHFDVNCRTPEGQRLRTDVGAYIDDFLLEFGDDPLADECEVNVLAIYP